MNHIIERDSVDMMTFAKATSYYASDMSDICSHLKNMLYDAQDNMQDETGVEAIQIIQNLVEELNVAIKKMNILAESVQESARIIEESDELI